MLDPATCAPKRLNARVSFYLRRDSGHLNSKHKVPSPLTRVSMQPIIISSMNIFPEPDLASGAADAFKELKNEP
jgi:hypothetical protein